MIQHRFFPTEPWVVRETELDLSVLAQTESIFALSNGHIGLRANLEEGEPHGLPGTYLNSFYETHPLLHSEPGYGYADVGQTLVNVTNGKIIRLLVDDEPFDVRYGHLRAHQRVLDLRAGVLRRQAEWVSPAEQAVRLSSVRLVSFAQRAVAAILYEVEPLGAPARLVVQSELVTNEPLPEAIKDDPRASSGVGSALRSEFFSDHDARVVLVHSTKESGLRMAAGMDHLVEGPPATQTTAESSEDLGRVTVATELEPEQRLRLVKFLGYGWSSHRSVPAVRDQGEAALPDAARDVLRWRHATLNLARERAKVLGLDGASFPWRTIGGQAASGYWPAGTAAFHINADIAYAVVRYRSATADDAFEREAGLELLVESARLWLSIGHHDTRGRFRIDGVTGPDEYSALADNNVYTNLMAQKNLLVAAEAAERRPDRAKLLAVGQEEVAAWRDAAEAIFIPYDEDLSVHPQAEEFTELAVWDFASTGPDQYPLLLHFHYFDLYRKQVVKQADLVLALYLRGDAFSAEEKARDFEYYEALTVRDSSLSAFVQAVVAAEVGHLELAYDYFGEAALLDLDNLHHNTRDGVHLASLAGAWIAAVAGFGGMRDHGGW